MTQKFLYVGAGGFYTEAIGYETSEYINTSAGAADAGKPVVLDAAGLISSTMVDTSAIDHGGLSGLGDDDHTQYSLVDGSRDYSGIVSYATHPSFTIDEQIVDKKYVDSLVTAIVDGLEWQDSVLTAGTLTPPGSPTLGDRYLILGTGTGAWAGKDDQIAEWDGSAWTYIIPSIGMFVSADDNADNIHYYGGSSWSLKAFENTTASTGLTKVGVDVQLASGSAGAGLAFTTGVLSVNGGDGIEVVGDNVVVDLKASGGLKIDTAEIAVEPGDFAGAGLIDDGSDNLAIDWSTAFNDAKAIKAEDINSIANGEGASIVGIEDAGGKFTATNVEAALLELYNSIVPHGVDYTVGTGGVTIGDLVYISGADTISEYGVITSSHKGIGLAGATVAAAGTVNVAANDTVLVGVLSGATAGNVYYWSGTALTTTLPTGTGGYVWQCGVSKNSTDLHVETRFVKRNI